MNRQIFRGNPRIRLHLRAVDKEPRLINPLSGLLIFSATKWLVPKSESLARRPVYSTIGYLELFLHEAISRD